MAKGKSPDTVLKGYWRDREHFADLFNAFLFGGRQVLHAQDFETEESEIALLLGTGADKRKIKRHRDVANLVRYVKKYETHFAILGIENQEQIHYAMPLRTMEYDVYTYVRQYKEKYADKEEWSGESFWSGMKREDKLIPVISLVIYYGEKPWDGAKSLKQMLKIPQELKQYVNDYPMHLIEMNKDRLPFKNKDNEELFEICRRLYAESETLAEKKESVLRYIEENKVSNSVISAATAAAGKTIKKKKKGENMMCRFFDELQREGERIGEARGKAEGERIGRLEAAALSVKNMMAELGVTLEKACQLAEITPESYREYVGTAGV